MRSPALAAFALVIIWLIPVQSASAAATDETQRTAPALLTNDAFITGLHTDLALEDVRAVFSYIFSRLDSHVTVYPSEGYYYFRLPMRGLMVRGCMTLHAVDLDDGVLGFGYVGEVEDKPHGVYSETTGRAHHFDRDDGLEMNRIDDFTYAVNFEAKTVVFHLYDPGTWEPEAGRLAPDEEVVGSSFDESGLRFHLLFNRTLQRMYWVLDERTFVPEALTALDDHVRLGARTRFVFYDDPEYNRRLLIGVHAPESSYNTWYDGPFDQLPDMSVKLGRIDMKRYLVAHTGMDPKVLDDYGHVVNHPGSRIPVASYRFYTDASDFEFVAEAVDAGLSRTELYAELTREAGRSLLIGNRAATH